MRRILTTVGATLAIAGAFAGPASASDFGAQLEQLQTMQSEALARQLALQEVQAQNQVNQRVTIRP